MVKRSMQAVLASLLVCGLAVAAQADVISINFGADEPGGAGSFVTGSAGVFGNSVWNNLGFATGSVSQLLDDSGSLVPVKVDWVSNNTWASTGRGEENNTAPAGGDRNLMTGYLDTSDTSVTTVTVSGLGNVFTDFGYEVIVYMKGGVNGRGGSYTIGAQTQSHVDTAAFNGTFVQGASGDYLVFRNVYGSAFTLTATPTTPALFRAPLNGIEIHPIPEPGLMGLACLGVIGLLLSRIRARG